MKKKAVIIVIIALINILCQGCQGQKKGEDIKIDYKKQDKKMREDIIQGLAKKDYKIPSHEAFRERILKVSGIDIDKYQGEELDFDPYDNFGTSASILKNINILIPTDYETYGKVDDRFIDYIMQYNRMVMYEDNIAVMQLNEMGYDANVYTYIAGTGYTGNIFFLKKVLDRVEKNYDKGNFHDLDVNDLLFGYTGQGNIIAHGPFRFEMLKKIEELKPDILFFVETQDISKYKLNKDEENKALAYIFNAQINQEYNSKKEYIGAFGIDGAAEDYFNKYPKYLEVLKEHNYYGFAKLKEYATIIYEPKVDNYSSTEKEKSPSKSSFSVIMTYTINDPDGYTNLRKEKNTTSSILEKVKTGESVEVIEQSGDWYLVKTKAGNQGYVHKTKIKVE
jgi:hypothetical protein